MCVCEGKHVFIYLLFFIECHIEFSIGVAIVLKRAKMVKKGSCNSNVANEDVIGTLIIQSKDLVQVVAKVSIDHSILYDIVIYPKTIWYKNIGFFYRK